MISMPPDPRLLVGWFRCVSTVGIACNLQVMETTLLVAQRQSRSSLAHFLRTDPPPSSRIFLPGLDSADVYAILACSLPLGGVFCICPVWAPHCRLRTSAPSTGSRESANWGMSNLQNLRLVPSTCFSVELPVLSYLKKTQVSLFPSFVPSLLSLPPHARRPLFHSCCCHYGTVILLLLRFSDHIRPCLCSCFTPFWIRRHSFNIG